MKHVIKFSFLLFSAIIIFSSCGLFIKGFNEYKSAKNYHKQRNFYKAAIYASKSLKQNANNKKALYLFEKSYESALELNKTKIKNFEKIESDSKWPKLYYVYDELKNLSKELESIQSITMSYGLDLLPQDYSEELNRLSPLAAEYHYKRGLEYRKKRDKQSQKNAANEFMSAQEFVSSYKNSKQMYEEARAAALITLLIRPFEGKQNLVNYIRDQLMMVQSKKSKEFLKIITRDQMVSILEEQRLQLSGMVNDNQIGEIGELSAANHILSASLVTTHRPSEKIISEDIEQEKNVVVRREKYLDDDGEEKVKKIKENVYATVDYYKKSAESNLSLTYQITDVNSGRLIYSGTVKTNSKFFHQWATYEGDKRALSSKYDNLCRLKEEFAPSKSELHMLAAQKLPKKLMKKISEHYSN